ncbi:g2661 [Coccomyxa viridis]|uniref:G2661 protein n=1 Tax=Coccomyxa viridis TaxID=1274662 RepID=A0ABP1FN80_9CHLO
MIMFVLILAAIVPLVPGQNSCQSLADNLFNGNCKSFVGYFKDKADYAISQSDAAFKNTAAGAPYPSDSCCYDAKDFSNLGCSCDAAVIGGARQNGVKENAVRIIPRATMYSRCNGNQFGDATTSGGC